MSRRLKTRLVKLKVALEALAISDDSFAKHWQSIFTETREPGDRRKGVPRKVFEDELAIAVEEGRAAVLLYRRTVGRL